MNEISATSISDEQRWEAVRLRNEVLDGTFVYAVRTMGIFCRPSCPSRQFKRENTIFFASSTEAEVAGYRACLRGYRHSRPAANLERVGRNRRLEPIPSASRVQATDGRNAA
ncbi:MAG: Ada metal-binding domain-containing protein [Gammaproteobacteria bacterium]